MMRAGKLAALEWPPYRMPDSSGLGQEAFVLYFQSTTSDRPNRLREPGDFYIKTIYRLCSSGGGWEAFSGR